MGLQENLSIAKKIGNFVSTILLGETKEVIIRTDERLKNLVSDIDAHVKPDLRDIRERFSATEAKVDTLWKDKYAPAHSPRQLNSQGNEILQNTGIKIVVDEQKEKLLKIIRGKNPGNPYDAEIMIEQVMSELPTHCPEVIDKLKEGAFNSGVDLPVVLLVGGIYLRNLVFPELGFKLDDLDKPRS